MKKRNLLIAGTAFLLSISDLSGANEFFACRVAKVKNPPQIDGILDETEWKQAARLPAFSNSTGILSQKRQDVMLCYDSGYLYVGLRADIDWEPGIVPVKFDDLNIWTVDSFDIALIPVPEKANDIVRFIVERGGGRADMRAKGQVKQPAGDWNPEWKSAVRLIAHSYMSAYTWEAEIAIPWKSLGISAPRKGDRIPAQFIRCIGNIRRDAAGNPDRVVTWSPVPKGRDWINPGDFGCLLFAGEKPVFRADPDSAFGVKGRCTAPVQASLEGRVWEIGHSGSPMRIAKAQKTDGMKLNWPGGIEVRRDTPSMMYWRLSDADGLIAGGKYITTLRPLFKVETAINYYRESVVILGDLRDLAVGKGFRVEAELRSKDGRVLERTGKKLDAGAKYFELNCSVRKLVPGTEGTVAVRLLDEKGRVQYDFSDRRKLLKRPAWITADSLGRVSVPPPGWETPVVKQAPGHIEVKTGPNAYCFGVSSPLPEAVELRNRLFSRGSFTLEAVTDRGYQSLKSAALPEILSQNARGVTFLWQGVSDDLEVKAEIRVEFDGMAWYRTQVIPRRKEMKLERLAVVMPLAAEQVRYMRGNNAMNVRELVFNSALVGKAKTDRVLPKPDMQFAISFSANGWTFGNMFHNFYWIGGEDRGIFFVLPSCRNMAVREKYADIIDDGDNFTAKFFLADHPLELKAPLDYEFGFFLTPTKEVTDRARLRRVGAGFSGGVDSIHADVGIKPQEKYFTGNARGRFFHDSELRPFGRNDVATLILPCWKLRTIQSGNPLPGREEREYIDRWIANTGKKLDASPMLWYDAFFTVFGLPHITGFLNDFEAWPITRLPVEQHGTYVCPTPAWQNFYLYGAQERMKQKITSFYMDLTFLKPCSNRFHGCGYRDADGNVSGVIPLLAAREMFLRYQTMVKKNNPQGLLVLHGYAATPLALWVDVLTAGEEWLTAPDYKTLTPEYFQSMLASTDQIGSVANFFPGGILMHYIQAQKSSTTLEEMCGLSFLHGESMWNGTEAMMPGLRMVWDTLDRFGVDQAVWTPYWRNPLSGGPEGVLVSSWKRGTRLLLVLFNPAQTERQIRFDALKSRRITDCLNNGNRVGEQITVPKRGFRLLLCE